MVITILREDDIAAARNAVRETGFALGFPVSALSAAQAIISEMCLYAINSGSTADLTVYALNRAGRAGISMVMQTVEVTEKELQDDRLTPGLGLPGAKRLSDHWDVSVRRGRTTVHAMKWQVNTFRWLKRRRTKLGSSDARPFSMASALLRWPFFTQKQ
jgi:anti-sigma regulatory factor (Ser/Thr protein kinase)